MYQTCFVILIIQYVELLSQIFPSEMMMTAGLSPMDLYIILIVVLVVIVIFVLVLTCYLFHRKHAGRQQGEINNQRSSWKSTE